MAGAPTTIAPATSLGSFVSLATSMNGDLPPELIDLNPWLAIIELVTDILELAGIIPNPWSLLFSLFTGRPREQATLLQAQRLFDARNPAARLAGVQLQRMVNEWDIVTSEGGPGRAILNAWASQFVANLVAQGVAQTRAQDILVAATSEAAQSGLPLEPELKAALGQGMTFNAPQQVATEFLNQYETQITKGLTINNALKAAEQWLFKNAPLSHLFYLQLGEYIPTTPPAQQVVPGQDGTCPPGYTLDPTTELCVYQPTTPPGQLPPPPPPSPIGPDPQGDEITNTLCAQMNQCAQNIISAIQALQSGGNATDPDCCQNVVNAITGISTALASILSVVSGIPGSSGAPVDLSGVVAALDALVSAVSGLAPTGSVDLTPIVQALEQINQTLAAGQPLNLQPIVDQLKAMVTEGDVAQGTFQYLAQQGFLTSDEIQFYQGMGWADALFTLLRRIGYDLAVGFCRLFGWDLTTGTPYTRSLASDTIKLFADSFNAFVSGSDAYIEPTVSTLVQSLKGIVAPAATPPLGSAGVDLDAPVAFATSVALSAGIASYSLSILGIDVGEPLARIAEVIAAAVSFETLRDVQIGPLVRNGVAKVADMNAKALFAQEIPNAAGAVHMMARRILDPNTGAQLLAWNGINPQIRAQIIANGYVPLSPRALVTALADQPFDAVRMQAILEDNAYSDTNVQFLLQVLQYNSTKNVRNSYVSELLTAHAQGVVSEDELTTALNNLGWSNDAIAFVQQRAALQRRVTLAKKVEASVIPLVAAGAMTPDQGTAQMEAAGIVDWYTQLEITLATTKASVAMLRKELSAEAKLALQRERAQSQQAVKQFQDGVLDAAGLTAALLAAGVDPVIAASSVAVQQAIRTGKLRLVYGQLLSPADAKVLEDRVAAIGAQTTTALLKPDQALANLTLLGVDQPEAAALVAKWLASMKSTPGPVVLLSPITGQIPTPGQIT